MLRNLEIQTMLAAGSINTTPVVIGVPVNVESLSDVVLYIQSAATSTNNFTGEVYVQEDGAAPTVVTAMHWIQQIVLDVDVRAIVAVPITAAAKWIWLFGAHATGAAALTVYVTGVGARQGTLAAPLKQTILSATNVTTTPGDIGAPVNVDGGGNVTLYVQSAATTTNDLTLEVFVAPSGAVPSATTSMHWLRQIVVDVSEKKIVAVPLKTPAKYVWVNGQHASASAATTIEVVATPANQ